MFCQLAVRIDGDVFPCTRTTVRTSLWNGLELVVVLEVVLPAVPTLEPATTPNQTPRFIACQCFVSSRLSNRCEGCEALVATAVVVVTVGDEGALAKVTRRGLGRATVPTRNPFPRKW